MGQSKKLFIDCEKPMVSWELPGDREEGFPAPTYFAISFLLQGRLMHLIIDTGFQGILLYKDCRSCPPGEKRSKVGSELTRLKVPGVRLSGSEMVTTVFLTDGPGTGDLPGVNGWAGIGSLKAKRVEFDFAAKVLRWQSSGTRQEVAD